MTTLPDHKNTATMKNRILHITLPLFLWLPFCVSCNPGGNEAYTPASGLEGLVINEICGTQEESGDSWIELLNTTGGEINTSGMKIFLSDDYYVRKRIYSSPGTVVGAGEYLVLSYRGGEIDTGISASVPVEIYMTAGDGVVIDSFLRDDEIGKKSGHPDGGSYSRLPDGTGKWFVTSSATSGEKNFGYSNRNGVWMWSTHLMGAPLATLASKGIGHIILNEQAFKSYTEEEVLVRIAEAEALGMTVHIWIQCFYSNGTWISPVDDENKRYDQELFDGIIARAESYLDMGIEGIHLDYIRFGGTAHLHNHDNGVTGEGAVTEFCRQISARLKAKNSRAILSAALMWERESAYYYGQNSAAMGQYIDILMPMIYRYAEGSGSDRTASWARSTADYFAANSGGAEVWAGLQTYRYVSGSASGLSQEEILNDCRDFTETAATGVVLFRYGLGNFPDLTNLWD